MPIDHEQDDSKFVIELEKHTSVLHSTNCVVFLEKTHDGSYMKDWLGPFDSYDKAYETATNLEGKSTPKLCGKCRVWDHKKNGSKATTELILKETSIEDSFDCIKAWLMGKGSDISEEEPIFLSGIVTSRKDYGTEIYREDAVFNLTQIGKDVKIVMELKIKSKYSLKSSTRVNSRIAEVKKELMEFLKDSMTSIDHGRFYSYRDAFKNLGKSSRPLLAKITEKTVENKNPKSVTYFLIGFSFLMLIIYSGLFFFFDISIVLENFIELILTYGAAIVFFYWIFLSDKSEREPIVFILIMFCWGIFSGLIAAPINGFIRDIIPIGVLVAPFVEEPVKAMGLYVFLTQSRTRDEFNSPLDGIIYGFAVGMGFYASENFIYYLDMGLGTLLIRILLCWGHGLWVAIVGLWISVNRHYRGYNIPQDLTPGLSVAIVLHFLWNLLAILGEGQFYLALFQFTYLRKIINEAKRDEFYAGDDSIVFSKLDEVKADRYSKSKLIFIILIISTVASGLDLGKGLIISTNQEWVPYEIYGIKFDRPERLWVETYGEYEGEEATEGYGEVWFGNYRGAPRELIIVKYGNYAHLGWWDSMYDGDLFGDEFELGSENEFTVNGHKALYRRFNMTYNGNEFHSITSGWGCKDSWHGFVVQVYTADEDYYDILLRILDSFKCH